MAKKTIKLPIGSMATPRRIGINGFNNTTAAGNMVKKNLPYRKALINGKTYGRSATTRSGTGTMLNDPPPPYRPDMADETTAPRRPPPPPPPPRVIGGLTAVVAFVAFVVVRANPLVAPSSSSSFFIRTANATARVVLVVRVLAPPTAFHRRVDIVVDIVDIVVIVIIVAAQSNQSNRINQISRAQLKSAIERTDRPTKSRYQTNDYYCLPI